MNPGDAAIPWPSSTRQNTCRQRATCLPGGRLAASRRSCLGAGPMSSRPASGLYLPSSRERLHVAARKLSVKSPTALRSCCVASDAVFSLSPHLTVKPPRSMRRLIAGTEGRPPAPASSGQSSVPRARSRSFTSSMTSHVAASRPPASTASIRSCGRKLTKSVLASVRRPMGIFGRVARVLARFRQHRSPLVDDYQATNRDTAPGSRPKRGGWHRLGDQPRRRPAEHARRR